VPREIWMDTIRGQLFPGDPNVGRSLAEPEALPAEDELDDPVPVLRLAKQLLAGRRLDPEEVYEVLDALDTVVIGDPDRCLEKMKKFQAVGADRLMCLMQFGALAPERVLGSLRLAGEVLIPALARG
jgi:alkanesulfonate monooxygenase SsuD/methylene tetrahydromethanopterin reductase-like flavin-dependent oxidoreductase (luciferase family)